MFNLAGVSGETESGVILKWECVLFSSPVARMSTARVTAVVARETETSLRPASHAPHIAYTPDTRPEDMEGPHAGIQNEIVAGSVARRLPAHFAEPLGRRRRVMARHWEDGGTPRWVYLSLLGATAYVVGSEGLGMLDVLARQDEIAEIVPGGYRARLFLRPFVVTATALSLWWFFFRHEAEGARVMALFAALFLLASSVVMWLSMQVSDWRYSPWHTVGYPLCALAYLVYAIRGRER